MEKEFLIENKVIGGNQKTFIVAEIGANHNSDLSIIKKTIDKAIEANVDAIKFQTYKATDLVADYNRKIEYKSNGKIIENSIGNMFKNLELPSEWHEEIFNYVRSKNKIVFSTPFSLKSAEFLNKLSVPCFKLAASDVNYVDMLEKIPQYEKPIMLSLGKCTLSEADNAINCLLDNGAKEIVLMHCVAQYPSPIEEMNLNIIKSLKMMYPETVIGFSDHSQGIVAALGAVALGAKVIEKHFTLDKTLDGPDHWFSMDYNDMKLLVDSIRNLELAMGSSRKKVLKCEEDERKKSIRSLVLNKEKKKGELINRDDLKMLRPGTGISPFDRDKIIGMKLNKDLAENSVLNWSDIK